jgi:hypothetical protein
MTAKKTGGIPKKIDIAQFTYSIMSLEELGKKTETSYN